MLNDVDDDDDEWLFQTSKTNCNNILLTIRGLTWLTARRRCDDLEVSFDDDGEQ